MNNTIELAKRIYNIMDPWERCDISVEDIAASIEEDPTETINYLLNLLEA